MTERTSGWRAALSEPWIFEFVQHAVGARRWLKRFVRETMKPRPGDRILDIGCGPAAILSYLHGVQYYGFDHSAAYIDSARRKFGDRGHYICGDVSTVALHNAGPFEIAIAVGILHHIGDSQALKLLSDVREALVPGGRLITADPCFFDGQPWITRMIVANDRGLNVREFDQYLALARTVFPTATAELDAALLPFPRAVCQMICRKD